MTAKHRNPLLDAPGVLGPMLRLAAPVLVEQLLIMMVAFVDQWLAGEYLGPSHLAAIGLIWYVLWLLPALFGVVAIGAVALVARATGAGRRDDARRATHQALLLGAAITVAATAAAAGGARWFVQVMQLPPAAASLAQSYLNIITPAIPAIMVIQVGNSCLRGAGDTLSGFLAMTVVNLVNAGLGLALVTGWGPFPQWGWNGLAAATAVGQTLGALLIVAFLRMGRGGLCLKWSLLTPDRTLAARLLKIGVPGGADMLAVVLCHLWFLALVNRLGVMAAASHGLAIRLESLAYLPGVAFQVAATTLAGQYLGAGDLDRAWRGATTACWAGAAVMSAMGAVFFVWADAMTAALVSDANLGVAQAAAPLLRVVAFSMPSLAITMVLTGALRGAGDTKWPLLITLIGFLGLRIPLAYWLTQAPAPGWSVGGLGVVGAWYAMVADIVLRSLLVAARFRQGGWRKISV